MGQFLTASHASLSSSHHLSQCQMKNLSFVFKFSDHPSVLLTAITCNITSNGLCIAVGGRELLERSRQTCFTDVLLPFLLVAGQSKPRVVEPCCVRGRGRGAGTGVWRQRLRVQLGAEWLLILKNDQPWTITKLHWSRVHYWTVARDVPSPRDVGVKKKNHPHRRPLDSL